MPTILFGDVVFALKIKPGSNIAQGAIVIFRPLGAMDKLWVKRVVGFAGDHVQMRKGVLFINGSITSRTPISSYLVDKNGRNLETERYSEAIPSGATHDILKETDNGWANNTGEFVVSNGTFFVMGDNRDDSADSGFAGAVGYVDVENVVGKATWIF